MWIYLSFADENDFLGACMVEAPDPEEALHIAKHRKLDPGGDVMALMMGSESPAPFPPYKLLSRQDLDADGPSKTVGELADAGVTPGNSVFLLRRKDRK